MAPSALDKRGIYGVQECPAHLRLRRSGVDSHCLQQEGGKTRSCRRGASAPAGEASVAKAGYPTRVFFGDTHLHTAMSMDAGAFGNRLGIEDAYRFAARRRGAGLERTTGEAVADRSISWSSPTTPTTWVSSPICSPAKPEILADPTGKKWYDMIKAGEGNAAALDIIDNFSRGTFPEKLMYFPGTPAYGAAWKQTLDCRREVQRRPARSPPSSATSGPRRCRPATTCIGS